MGDAYFATAPHCPTHKGQMTWKHPTEDIGGGWRLMLDSYWICHGFDGEGCEYVVREKDMNWRKCKFDADEDR